MLIMKPVLPAAMALLLLPQAALPAAVPARPNIILILADDLGYGDLGCYGSKRAQTPHLDRMAREGLRFSDFHSNGPVCSPTRAALLTGRYQQRFGIDTALSETSPGMDKSAVTIAQRLQEAGYATAIFGKWHLGSAPEESPNHFGFQLFRGAQHGGLDYQSHVTRSGRLDWWHNAKLENEEGYATTLITRHAVDFIKAHRDGPFLLYVPYTAIHFPWMTPHDPAYHQIGEDTSDLRKLGPHKEKNMGPVVVEMIEALDAGVGEILSAVEKTGLGRQTFVFFTSDNGGYLSYQGGFANISSNGPLRGQKGAMHEGGHRVPAIAWWPGRIKAGSVTNATAMTMDLMPTYLELAGIAPTLAPNPKPLDGISLAPLLFEGKSLPNRTLFWRYAKSYAARSGPWKLVASEGKAPELYNLENDLGETRDLASQQSALVQKLRSELAAWEEDVASGAGKREKAASKSRKKADRRSAAVK